MADDVFEGGGGGGGGAGAAPTQEIKLFPYDPEAMLSPDSIVLVVGPRSSGKTTFMKYLLFCMRHKLDNAVAFIPTADTRAEFEEFMPRCNVYAEFTEARLRTIVSAQKQIHDAQVKKHGATGATQLRRLGIILDDCMFKKREFDNDTCRNITMNGRHDNLFFLNGIQYIVNFPKEQRSQLDVAVVFPVSGVAFLKAVWENLLSDALTLEQTETLLSNLNAHECLVFDARAFRRKQPYLFVCKAMFHLPPFRLGNDLFWRLYYKHFVRQNTGTHAALQIAAAVAQAKSGTGTGVPPSDGAAVVGATGSPQQPIQGNGFIIRRMPVHTAVPMVAGPGEAPPPPPRSPRKKASRKPQYLQLASVV